MNSAMKKMNSAMKKILLSSLAWSLSFLAGVYVGSNSGSKHNMQVYEPKRYDLRIPVEIDLLKVCRQLVGVDTCWPRDRYGLFVLKGGAFRQSEVEPQVLQMIKRFEGGSRGDKK